MTQPPITRFPLDLKVNELNTSAGPNQWAMTKKWNRSTSCGGQPKEVAVSCQMTCSLI